MPWFLPNARSITPSDIDDCRARAARRVAIVSCGIAAAAGAVSATPAAALYAFCRVADDADRRRRLPGSRLRGRSAAGAARSHLSRAPAKSCGRPRLCRGCRAVTRSRARLPEALLEGFAWDADARRYETIEDLRAYAARVAGSVGVMMTLVMGRRDPAMLARACDLGVAMQLTNICRDVGEDARAGRLYLPLAWLRDSRHRSGSADRRPGFSPGTWRCDPRRARACGPALPARCAGHCRAAGILPPGYPCRAHALCRDRPRDRAAGFRQRLATRGGAAAAQARSRCSAPCRRSLGVAPSRRGSLAGDAVPARCDAGRASAREPAVAPWYRVRDRAIWTIDLFERLERERRAQMQRVG